MYVKTPTTRHRVFPVMQEGSNGGRQSCHHSLNLLLRQSHVPEAIHPTIVVLAGPVLLQAQQPPHLPAQGMVGGHDWGELLLPLMLQQAEVCTWGGWAA